MSDQLVTRWNAKTQKWNVYRLGEFARYVATFDTLLDAEDWACGRRARCGGRAATAHEPTLMVDGSCPVCGEEAS